MKINFNVNSQKKMFMDIEEGETFFHNGDIYIKGYHPCIEEYMAIRLKDGFVDDTIDDVDDVIVVKTELNVDNSPF